MLEKKPPSVNRRIFRVALPVFLALIALIFIGFRLFYSVRTITVVGNERIPTARVLELSGVRIVLLRGRSVSPSAGSNSSSTGKKNAP